ncbi:hypothetical protein [Nocardia noduli]|uniref:hypothetical protein n=1 Tax=Nocardia noduli TaxID=2815722 RepID=UPI001C21C425|nr:hypothetical protein [Nocardia noduli]
MPDQPTTATTPVTRTSRFDLGAFGVADTEVRRDSTGGVVYTVTAPHIRGAITVRVDQALATDTAQRFFFAYGIDTPGTESSRNRDRLTVQRSCLVGWNSVHSIEIAGLADSGRGLVTREDGSWGTEAAPPATAKRTRALLAAVLADFAAREDLAEMHHIAAVRDATDAISEFTTQVAGMNAEIAKVTAERDRVQRLIDALTLIRDGAELPARYSQVLAEVRAEVRAGIT